MIQPSNDRGADNNMTKGDTPHAAGAVDRLAAHVGNGQPGAAVAPQAAEAYAPEAWFLGPLGENADEFERLVVEALRDHVFWRRNFHPGDQSPISEASKRSPQYLRATDSLKHSYRSLLAILKKSVPFFSERYQGHMSVDLALPSLLGYFAAMLYNPNNVAFEGSTATTLLEMIVGDDLCQMLGYPIDGATDAPRPWGHITSGGTVANIEALWTARNLKFYPVALQAALVHEPSLADARDLLIETPMGTTVCLRTADLWTLLNLRGDDILALPERLQQEAGIAADVITAAVNNYSLQSLGLSEFTRRFLGELAHSPLFFVPGTKHYSFPKAAALLGMGAANMVDVALDLDARMDINALRRHLTHCLEARRPVYTVVSVMGSTEESAVDPLAEILALRAEFRQQGLEFTVHADAAWGGYHTTLLRADQPTDIDPHHPGTTLPPFDGPSQALSSYVTRQLSALTEADSITVDPHKGGYMPYPAGALCYRNSAMRSLVTFDAPYMYHGEAEPTVGIYGIEGSKPGAAAAAVYLSHRCIPPSRQGYGRIIEQATWRCKLFYARLLTMARPEDPFIVVPLMRLPASESQEAIEAQLRLIGERIDRRPMAEILADHEAMTLLAELGPDLNILAYAFNFKTMRESVNSNLALANRLNQTLYQRFSIKPHDDIYGYNLIVSTTELDAAHYGSDFIADYKRRLGVQESPGERVTVLRSVIMDPWSMASTGSAFLDLIEGEFRSALLEWSRDRNFHLVEGWFAGKRTTQ